MRSIFLLIVLGFGMRSICVAEGVTEIGVSAFRASPTPNLSVEPMPTTYASPATEVHTSSQQTTTPTRTPSLRAVSSQTRMMKIEQSACVISERGQTLLEEFSKKINVRMASAEVQAKLDGAKKYIDDEVRAGRMGVDEAAKLWERYVLVHLRGVHEDVLREMKAKEGVGEFVKASFCIIVRELESYTFIHDGDASTVADHQGFILMQLKRFRDLVELFRATGYEVENETLQVLLSTFARVSSHLSTSSQ